MTNGAVDREDACPYYAEAIWPRGCMADGAVSRKLAELFPACWREKWCVARQTCAGVPERFAARVCPGASTLAIAPSDQGIDWQPTAVSSAASTVQYCTQSVAVGLTRHPAAISHMPPSCTEHSLCFIYDLPYAMIFICVYVFLACPRCAMVDPPQSTNVHDRRGVGKSV